MNKKLRDFNCVALMLCILMNAHTVQLTSSSSSNGKSLPLSNHYIRASTNNVYRFEPIQIVEEPPIGTLIIDLASKLNINDLATSDYKFRFYSPHSITAHYFMIDQLTGDVKTQRSLDREYLCETKACGPCTSTNNCTLPIEIVAQQHGSSFRQQKFVSFDVIIEDKNEFAPKFPRDSIVLNISENAPVNFTVPIDAAIDRDSKQSKIVYKLMPVLAAAAGDDKYDESEIEKITSRIHLSLANLPQQQSQLQQQSQQEQSQSLQQLSLTILRPFDYETEKEFSFRILASDSGAKNEDILTGVCQVTLKIIDLNDNIPVFDKQEYEYRLDEDKATSGTKLIRVHAMDRDDSLNGLVKYYFVDQTLSLTNPSQGLLQQQQLQSQSIRNIFQLDELTGWISVAPQWPQLDFEQSPVYRLTVRAQDSGGSNSIPVYTSVTIYLNDVNDNPPQISLTVPSTLDDFSGSQSASSPLLNTAVNQLEISEWTPIEQFLAQVVITDLDSGLNGKLKLDMTQFKKKTNQDSWHPADDFILVHLFNNIYSLMTKHTLDREAYDLYSVNITVTDQGQPFSLSTTHKLLIRIKDENDNAPRFVEVDYAATTKLDKNGSAIAYEFNIYESVESRENWIIIGRVKAIDQDLNENAVIRYGIDGASNVTSLFRIDPETGLIRGKSYAIDRELTDAYELRVIATDDVNESVASLTVKILDLNDNRPVFEHHTYQFKVKESDPPFTRIGNVKAVDSDKPGSNFSLIKYSIQGENPVFKINELTGDIYLLTELDYETMNAHELKAIATDGGLLQSSPCLIQIEVVDVNDNRPLLLTPSDSTMPLLFPVNQLVNNNYLFTLNATDLDVASSVYGRVRFTLDDEIQIDDSTTATPNSKSNEQQVLNIFECDPATGQVTLKLNDYETSDLIGVYALVFKLSDYGGLTTQAYVFVAFQNRSQLNDTVYSARMSRLRQLITDANLNSQIESSDTNEIKFKRLIKQLNSPDTDVLFSSESKPTNGTNKLAMLKMKLIQVFTMKNYKYFIVFLIAASIMIVFIVLTLLISVCFYRQHSQYRKKDGGSVVNKKHQTYGVILNNNANGSASPSSSITSSELIDNSNFLNTSATNSDETFNKKIKSKAINVKGKKHVNIYSQKPDQYDCYYDEEDDEDGFAHLKKMATLKTESSNGLSTKSPSQQSSTASLIRINRFKKSSANKKAANQLKRATKNSQLKSNDTDTQCPVSTSLADPNTLAENVELLGKKQQHNYDSNLNTSGEVEERSVLMLNTNSPTNTTSSTSSSAIVSTSLSSSSQHQQQHLLVVATNSMFNTTLSSNRNKMVASSESLASLNSLITVNKTPATTTNVMANQQTTSLQQSSSRSSATSQDLNATTTSQRQQTTNELLTMSSGSPNSFRTFKINYSSPNRQQLQQLQQPNSYRTMPIKSNFEQKQLNLPVNELFKRYELKMQGASTVSSGSIASSIHSSLSSLPQHLPASQPHQQQPRKIVEINIRNINKVSPHIKHKQLNSNSNCSSSASSNSSSSTDSNDVKVPDYFFKDEKEYKKFLANQNKLNCKHVIETETETR